MSQNFTASSVVAWVRTRLSVMMLLQYAIWGAWLPLLWPYLFNVRKFTPVEIGYAFAVGALGAIIAPFLAGQIADRYFNTEKVLGISHILGGILVFQLASIESLNAFLIFSFVYSLVYSPTLSLTNSISFHHIDRDRDFGKVRLWGTVGWIAVGLAIGQWLLHSHTPTTGTQSEIAMAQFVGMADAFRLSGILGIVMGVYCFTLPATPPVQGKRKNATFEALGEVRTQPLLVLFLLAVPLSCIHQFYFMHAASFLGAYQANAGEDGFTKFVNSVVGVGGGGLMTIGQMSEIVVLALIPVAAGLFSRKSLLAIGVAAYALRMLLFAVAPQIAASIGLSELAVLIPAIALHGLCFGCFIFVSFMIVDEETSNDVRASAQSLYNLVIIGIGIIVGSFVAGEVASWATVDGKMDYERLFGVPMYGALGCLVALALFYNGRVGKRATLNQPA
ncbi:MAG: MFS transporter [Phycisphaerales bacterium]|nr:MFS transporter [Phycisphaerales bacterium]